MRNIMPVRPWFLFLLALGLVEKKTTVTNAFVGRAPPPAAAAAVRRILLLPRLHLTPSQGSQLVDAFNAAHPDDDPENYHPAAWWYKHGHKKEPSTASTRSSTSDPTHVKSSPENADGKVVSKKKARALLDRLLSLPLTTHPHDQASATEDKEKKDDDVVYYPVIGFTYVPDAADHSRALPTVSNPSCRLVYEQLLEHQEVYGEWHAPRQAAKEAKGQQQQQQQPPQGDGPQP